MSIKMCFSMRYQNTQDFYNTHIIFELLACLTPGFQGHEQHKRLIEMENNSIFSHIRTYFRVLDRDNDNLDHAVMHGLNKLCIFVHRSKTAVNAVKILTNKESNFSSVS